MSAQEIENRKGCNRRVVWFFVFAVACVAAFLIVGLVRTCTTEHQEKEEIELQETSMVKSSLSINWIA